MSCNCSNKIKRGTWAVFCSKAYSGQCLESFLFAASCHDLCSSPQLFLCRAGEESTSFSHYGCCFAALGGTAPRRASVAEYVPHWAASSSAPPTTEAARSRCRPHLHVPVQPVIRVEGYRGRGLQSELVILICLWTRGSGQVLRLKGGQHTCTRGYYQFKDTFSYDPMTLLSPPLEVAQRQLLGQRTDLLILQRQRPWDAVEKRRHR